MNALAPAAEQNPAPPATVGIMICTFNRLASLKQCLKHLEAQTCRDFEVLVMVDGSTDGTVEELQRYRHTANFPLRYVVEPNGGLAHARNQALKHIRSPVCLMIGDDIFTTPTFVATHLAFHRANPQRQSASVGYTRWSETGQVVTPFMRWLDRDGVQFAYGALLAGVQPTWQHFYSCNLSVKTALLRDNPSCEGFKAYGLEDIELGYRLFREEGLEVSFLRQAVADHLHPATFLGTCNRALRVGEAAYIFGQLWPEHRYHTPKGRLKRWLLPLLSEPRAILPLLRWTTNLVTKFWCPNPLLKPVLVLHERLGYRRAVQAAGQATE